MQEGKKKSNTTGHSKGETISVTLNHWLLAIPYTPSQDRHLLIANKHNK